MVHYARAKSLREDSEQRAVEDPVVEAVDELLDERSTNATVEPLKRRSADAKAQQGGNHSSTWREFRFLEILMIILR